MEIGESYNPYGLYYGALIPNGILELRDLSNRAKICWAKMVQHSGKKGFCYPKQETLAEECGMSRTSIQKAIKELIDYKLIKVEYPVGREKLQHLNNKYVFLKHEWENPKKPDEISLRGAQEVELPSEKEVELLDNKIISKSVHCKKTLLRKVYNESADADSSPRIIKLKRNKSLSDEIEQEQRKDQNIIRRKKREKKLKERRKYENVVMPSSIKNIIEHWNKSPLKKMKMNTKTHQITVDSLKGIIRGTFFQNKFHKDHKHYKFVNEKISCDKIIEAINNFALATDNPFFASKESTRAWYKKRSLKDFIFLQYPNKPGESLLLKFIEYKPTHSNAPTTPLPDKYPELSLRLKNLYVQNVLGGVNGNMSEKDLNSFKIGAEKIHEFYKQNSRRITSLLRGEKELPDLLFKALEENSGGKMQKIKPWKFSSDRTYSHDFPSFLLDQGMLTSKMVSYN